MSVKLKKLADQVMVITGASSGIGLATAESAANAGAKVVLAARSKAALEQIAARLEAAGGEALAVATDVADEAQVKALADAAVTRFGRIDTWVNNAGLGMWGRLDQTETAEARKLYDVNFWGVVHGSMAALPHLKKQGGALINVGSEVSDDYPPIQGMYASTKHAVKGYTDALRVEIEGLDKAPVSITLIQPQAVDTPFPQHARNFTDKEPMLPKPMVEPQQVADAILHAAQHPIRAKAVGGMSVLNTTMARVIPGLADKMAATLADKMHYDEPPRNPSGALHQPSEATGVVGQTHGTGGREPK